AARAGRLPGAAPGRTGWVGMGFRLVPGSLFQTVRLEKRRGFRRSYGCRRSAAGGRGKLAAEAAATGSRSVDAKGRLAPALSLSPASRRQADSHHIQNASHRRPEKPASSTASIATSGAEAIVFPAGVAFTVPIFWPLAIGATRVRGTSIVGLSCSYLPRGLLTTSGRVTPRRTSSALPFHTFCVATGLPTSYSLC